jgi:glutathione synthase/RimK-type ligase-like ATP-grasp enzyme
MKAVARAAMEALKLDFGAVDIGLVKTQPFVIEVNTCPGLESGTLALYLEQFLERGK